MKKKNYMKPTVKVVQLQHSQHILAGSYTGILTTGPDSDGPGYDGNSSIDIEYAN
jgi:hypothetical protein